MNLTELQGLEERYLMRTYRRGAVEFVRGEGHCSGTPTARSTSTSSPGSRSARSATAIPTWSRPSASRPGG